MSFIHWRHSFQFSLILLFRALFICESKVSSSCLPAASVFRDCLRPALSSRVSKWFEKSASSYSLANNDGKSDAYASLIRWMTKFKSAKLDSSLSEFLLMIFINVSIVSLCVLRCLAKQPADRFASYADLRDALVPYNSTAPTPATPRTRGDM